MKRRIACRILPGQFDNEQVVIFKSFDGKDLSLFAPGTELEFAGEPSFDSPVPGRMEVLLLGRKNGLALIRLPRQIPGADYFATVQEDCIEEVPVVSHV